MRQINCFSDRAVGPADYRYRFVFKEESVARRASRNTKSSKLSFGLEAKPFRLGAGCKDQRLSEYGAAAVAKYSERAFFEIEVDDMLVLDACADALGLDAHLLH